MQPIMRYGNPLATLRIEIRKLRQADTGDDYYSGDYYYSDYRSSHRKDMCTYCISRLANEA